jgi:hypothetical protein
MWSLSTGGLCLPVVFSKGWTVYLCKVNSSSAGNVHLIKHTLACNHTVTFKTRAFIIFRTGTICLADKMNLKCAEDVE